LFHYLFKLFRLVADDVDADQGKRLLFQVLDERPLVGPTGASSQSVFRPEVEQHDLPTVVAQLELLAVLIFTFDLRGFLCRRPGGASRIARLWLVRLPRGDEINQRRGDLVLHGSMLGQWSVI